MQKWMTPEGISKSPNAGLLCQLEPSVPSAKEEDTNIMSKLQAEIQEKLT